MKQINKIVNIGTQTVYGRAGTEREGGIFCKITYKEGKLSISGVIAPLRNGDALGSCGQIYDSIEPQHFAAGWDEAKLAEFVAIWNEWHLNDTKAYSVDMKVAGWDKLASKEIFRYSFSMTNDSRNRLADIKKRREYAALNNEIAMLQDEEKRLLQSETYKDVYSYTQPEAPEFMELSTDYSSKRPKIERKTLGWVDVKEHQDGLLGKELNGEKYGSKWYMHEVPANVLEYLQALPETQTKPAWV